jgi:hypothetical protein
LRSRRVRSTKPISTNRLRTLMTQGRDFLSRVARVCWLGQQYPCLSRYVDRHAIIASSSTPTRGLNIHSARTTPHLAGKSSGFIDLSVVSGYPRAAGKPRTLRETVISHLNRTPCRRTVGLLTSLGSTTYPVALIEYRKSPPCKAGSFCFCGFLWSHKTLRWYQPHLRRARSVPLPTGIPHRPCPSVRASAWPACLPASPRRPAADPPGRSSACAALHR